MMSKIFVLLVAVSMLFVGAFGALGKSPKEEAITPQAAFETLKNLAGEWQGTMGEKGGPPAAVIYEVTAAGSVVMETLMPGTDHEMVTVYHMDGDKLMLTHYCAAGNQPRMTLDKKSSRAQLAFNCAGGTNMKGESDLHMHGARFVFVDNDHFTCEWDQFKDGKKSETVKMHFTRKI